MCAAPGVESCATSHGGSMRAVLCCFILSFPLQGFSQERQNLAEIRKAVSAHLARETQGLPGEVSFSVGQVDPRLSLPACPALQTSRAPGAAPWGNTSVAVRCTGPTPWQIYVQASIKVVAEYAVTARPLLQGQAITAGDVSL